MLFTVEPFVLTSDINLSIDHRTRILLFAANLQLLPGETPADIIVLATDSRQFTYRLQVDQVTNIANLGWLSQIIVRLPDDLTITGDLVITIGIRGTQSTAARVAVIPP